jgi:hypothetical protein
VTIRRNTSVDHASDLASDEAFPVDFDGTNVVLMLN